MAPAFDIAGARALNGLAGQDDRLDAVFIFAASHLIFFMAALLLAYVLAAWKTEKFGERLLDAGQVFAAMTTAFLIERIIGFLWFRPRPFAAMAEIVKLIDKSELAKSFPSGHATAAFALAFGLFLHDRSWGRWMLLLAALVALGRIFVGVHYPSDVVAGAVVGCLAAWLTRGVKKAMLPILHSLRGLI
jgi:undecaprenyl-diphosphatase